MSDRGNGGKSRAKVKTRSVQAGLQFFVGRVHLLALVYVAAMLEYLAAEMLELAGNAARDSEKTRIIPRHLQVDHRTGWCDAQHAGCAAAVEDGGAGGQQGVRSARASSQTGRPTG
ncbi:Histone H2A type 1 [Taenia solium]|eukprot:TsM_000353000 transcript=TsM_000353000 gene=TsM_000353000